MLFRQRTFFVLERYEVCVKHGNACTEILHGVAQRGVLKSAPLGLEKHVILGRDTLFQGRCPWLLQVGPLAHAAIWPTQQYCHLHNRP